MSNNLETLLQNLEEERKNVKHSDGSTNFMDDARKYARFTDASYNHILQLIEIIRVQKEALDTIAKDKYRCKDFNLNFEGYILYAAKEIARVEEIAGRK